ncbi:type II secretion system protein [Deinococcus maricopensis]|uniref:type II secretion system protein n=1 Tax=Deinococcus maricopensis TaxID=309887 RepID=UPI000A075DD6|nr:type II secretion system protein [Deinococcus maricopensis]
MNQGAFTLIELLITIAIIGILGALLIPGLLGAQRRSYDAGAQTCAKSIQTVQAISQLDNRKFLFIGPASNDINRNSDSINANCLISSVFFNDRSDYSTVDSRYIIDVWGKHGSKVFTITPEAFSANTVGATSFSSTGAVGTNLP